MNINRLLENSARSDVIGRNIYTKGAATTEYCDGKSLAGRWDAPKFGLNGIIAVGHEIDIPDILTLEISENGEPLSFECVRNHWTPAFMESYYRNSTENQEYTLNGYICVTEKKAFCNDVFISDISITNDNTCDAELTVKLKLPFDGQNGIYDLKATTLPRAIGNNYDVKGFAAAYFEDGKDTVTLTISGGKSVSLRYGFALDTENPDKARKLLQNTFSLPDPFKTAEDDFNTWFCENAPLLTTDNTDILKVYYYRWFLIYHAIHTPQKFIPDHEFDGNCINESPFGEWFGCPVGLPLPMQIEEVKWMSNTDILLSQSRHWQKNHGTLYESYLQFTPAAIFDAYEVTGDMRLLNENYAAACEYLWLNFNPDTEELPERNGSWTTGAEYQPSFYQYTEPKWDWRNDLEGLDDGFKPTSLNRLDECCMLAANINACIKMAEVLNKTDDKARFEKLYDNLIEKIKTELWDENLNFFFDKDVKTGKLCDEAPSYDGFMPLMWDMVGKEYHKVFDRLNENEWFSSNFPFPSVGKDCPMYWFDNCIVGPTSASKGEPKHYECCWNGPNWPFADTIILSALGTAARTAPEYKAMWNKQFLKYTELHFAYGDRSVPVISEHYRASDGQTFSPHNDYFHSEWISLFMEYYAGITVTDGKISFMPFCDCDFTLKNVVIHGKKYTFTQTNQDGKLAREFFEQ